jgi:hypothetical protein
MNINDLTIGEAKELATMFGGNSAPNEGLNQMIGDKCIIRTYSAGVWFGEIEQKARNEVIVKNARRLWRWHTKKSVSLSAIANGDIDESKCRIAGAVGSVWLEAIELIPCDNKAIKIIEGAKEDEAV